MPEVGATYYFPTSVVELSDDIAAGMLDDDLEVIYWAAVYRRNELANLLSGAAR